MIKLEFVGEGTVAYATKDSAGFDLCSQEDLVIQPGEYKLIDTGVRIIEHSIAEKAEINGVSYRIVPELQVRARSGLAAKYGVSILNGIGSVDGDYRGIIKVNLSNFGKSEFKVNKGDRIAQAMCSFVLQLPCVSVKDVERGTGGFGSTGTN
jgi:dUTP pyrophosphatase